ncbi:hypothetical protein D3C71_1408580 [compost metagenome]
MLGRGRVRQLLSGPASASLEQSLRCQWPTTNTVYRVVEFAQRRRSGEDMADGHVAHTEVAHQMSGHLCSGCGATVGVQRRNRAQLAF